MARAASKSSSARTPRPSAKATLPPDEHAPQRTTIEQLEPLDLDLLAVLALVSDALARSRWSEHAQRRGLLAPGGRALTPKDLEDVAARLCSAGLVETFVRANYTGYHVPAEIAMQVLEVAQSRGRLEQLAPIAAPSRSTGFSRFDLVGEMRLAVVRNQPLPSPLAHSSMYLPPGDFADLVMTALGSAPRPGWIERLPPSVRGDYLARAVRRRLDTLQPLADHVVTDALATGERTLAMDVGRALALRGDLQRALEIDHLPKWGREGLSLIDAFWHGDPDSALAIGERAIAGMTGRKLRALGDLEGALHLVAAILASARRPELVDGVVRLFEAMGQLPRAHVGLFPLADLLRVLVGEPCRPRPACDEMDRDRWVTAFVHLLHDAWLPDVHEMQRGDRAQRVTASEFARQLAGLWSERARSGGYVAVGRELESIRASFEGTPRGLAAGFRPPAAWETALASLESAAAEVGARNDATVDRAIVWEVVDQGDGLKVQPRLRAGTRAKKGQTISLTRLLGGDLDELLDDLDRRVLATATHDPWRRGYAIGAPELTDGTWPALVGHPRVVGSNGSPIVVERGRPRLRTARRGDVIVVELEPRHLVEHDVVIDWPAPARIVVFERSAELARLAEIIARGGGLAVPDAGRERLARALGRLAAAADVDVDGELTIGAQVIDADPRPVLRLHWDGDRLVVALRAAPLGLDGPSLLPGAGAAELVGEIRRDGELLLHRCSRDLADERKRCDAVLDGCPTLGAFQDAELHWTVPTLADALAVMLELDALGETIVLAWQAGRRLEVPGTVDLDAMRLAVGRGTAWLELDVAVHVDESTVLRFRDLVRHREGDRFLALPRGRFIAMSERLRRHLEKLESLGHAHGDGLRASPAALGLVDELASQMQHATFDAATRARLEELRSLSTFVPRMPRGFGTTLRDYQREGFEWITRLAEAGLGACLADDMGLGKTVQALAVLAQRAKRGPALVTCPTSVVANWIDEARRFCPMLRFSSLAAASDRGALVRDAGPRDVVICSHTLLAAEIEILSTVSFATIVLDEAHALKNARTQRATAARRLGGDFRLALTGTPIENHVRELWSLFACIVPGLLGTEGDFEERFGTMTAGDRDRSSRLRAIVRPFVLRRLKSQVLDELPPRTEITLRIAPYPEQVAYYEAVRRQAVERTASVDPKKKRFRVLAEIMRLRQAAIDPRLLDGAGPKGAKIDVLFERLHELRAEGHRALVFTQFLGSLAAVRERLIADGIEHFSLDGATPAPERARRIAAFQAGEGDVFLLSLRAGGTGVNLTGADYVFHLDPWWNPAVEDQASDRAHRIGQSRPVTIYRLVTQGSIEEKILALHDSKRELADDLLAGLDRADSLDLDRLLELLSE